MMNTENLHELIRRYEENLDMLYGAKHDELFKWRSMKTWQQEWMKPEGSFSSFADRFSAAKKDFRLFMDNSRMHPSSGVIKLWEKEPETVVHLFQDVLFADASGDAAIVQEHMDTFLDDYEALRQKYFPGNWSYKQDRHSASVFLALNDPDFNFVFKSSEAQMMAKYTEFGYNIGAGTYFSLKNYYLLGEEIISALKEHSSLLEKHFDRLTEEYYQDKSLHLLAFDLMYCSRTYGFYKGLSVPVIAKVKKKPVDHTQSAEELAKKEDERIARIAAIEREIEELEQACDGCEDISLLGVQVTSTQYGTGTVVEQNRNKISVQFPDIEKSFILDKKYLARPRFENDDEIIEAFTAYGRALEKINALRRQLEQIENGLDKGVSRMVYTLNSKKEISSLKECAYSSEQELQEIIAANPCILQRPSDSELYLIKRELTLPGTFADTTDLSLDHFMVDVHAVPMLVEVKQVSNPEIRRKVVGQMLEYASRISYYDSAVLQEMYSENSETECPDGNPHDFWKAVSLNLQAGNLRLVFAADSIPTSLKAIIELLDRSMPNIDVYGVEIKKHISGNDVFLSTNFVLNNAKTTARELKTKYSDADMEAMLISAYHGTWPYEFFKKLKNKAESLEIYGKYGNSEDVIRFRFYKGKESFFSFDTDKNGGAVYFGSKTISQMTQERFDVSMLRARLEEIDPNAKYTKNGKSFVWLRAKLSCLKNEANQEKLFCLLDDIAKAIDE